MFEASRLFGGKKTNGDSIFLRRSKFYESLGGFMDESVRFGSSGSCDCGK